MRCHAWGGLRRDCCTRRSGADIASVRAALMPVIAEMPAMHRPAALCRPPLAATALERLRAACEHVFASPPAVTTPCLYGSRARGEPLADLDIAVLTERGAVCRFAGCKRLFLIGSFHSMRRGEEGCLK